MSGVIVKMGIYGILRIAMHIKHDVLETGIVLLVISAHHHALWNSECLGPPGFEKNAGLLYQLKTLALWAWELDGTGGKRNRIIT